MATAAAYLRKSSSEGQTADTMKSVNQQLEEIRAFAASKGWTLDDRYVYKDDEISGEEWANARATKLSATRSSSRRSSP
jgi:DNA invertase Pin-like site-specific DNA recombinase